MKDGKVHAAFCAENMIAENDSYLGSPDDPRTAAYVCYITFVGWLIAYFALYRKGKTDFAGFHMRQSIMIHILSFALKALYSFYGGYVSVIFFLLLIIIWLIGFLDAVNGRTKPVPVIGLLAQKVFRSL